MDDADTQKPRHKFLPFAVLVTSGGLSDIANVMTRIAIAWFVLQVTGSATQTGIVFAVTMLAPIVAGSFGGTLVDRIGYRRTAILSDIASGTTLAMIPLLYVTVGLAFWQILVLMFLGTLLDNAASLSRNSLIPDVARIADLRLERANSIWQFLDHGSGLVAPLLAGVLIASIGSTNVLWLTAALFGVSALMIATGMPNIVHARDESEAEESYWARMGMGFRLLWRDGLLFNLILVVAVLNFVVSPVFTVVIPVYANTVYGEAVSLGALLAGFAGGAIAGTIIYGTIGHRLPRRATLIAALSGYAIFILPLTLMPMTFVALVCLTLAGVINAPTNAILMTTYHERVPENMRGRVFGLMGAIGNAATPAGLLVVGVMLDVIGLQITILVLMLSILAIALSLLVQPSLHQMHAPVHSGGPQTSD